MANTLNVGLNTGTPSYFTPNNPFKDLIKNAQFGMRTNQVVSGVNYGRLLYAPSSFPNDVSSLQNNQPYLYISASSDENGWPTSLAYGSVVYYIANTLPEGSFSGALPASSTDDPNNAVFHIIWDGKGVGNLEDFPFSITYKDAAHTSNTEADVVQVSAGEYKVSGMDTETMNRLWVQIISTDPTDHVRNVRFVHQDYRDTFESEPFLPAMVDYYKSVTTSGGPIRFMKWGRTNTSHFGSLSSVHGQSFDLSSTLVPEGTPQAGAGLGMSYTHQIRFANTAERDPWINIHYLADDQTVSAIASTIAAELDSDRKVYVELGNEWWNTQYPYILQITNFTAKAESLGGSAVYNLPEWNDPSRPSSWPPSDYDMAQAYGVQRSVEIFKIFENYFSSDKLKRVISGQLVQQNRNEGMLLFSGAYNHVDALAVNPYVGSILGNNQTVANAIETSGWNTDEFFDWMYQAVSGTDNITIAGNSNTKPTRKAITDTKNMLDSRSEFSGIEIFGYEGGLHLNVAVQGDARTFLIDLFGGTKYDPRWVDWTEYFLSTLSDYGMTTHCHFVDMSTWSDDDTTGVWTWFGVIPHLGNQTPTRTGLENYAEGDNPPDPPDPPGTSLPPEQQVSYRIDVNVNIDININP